MARFIGALACGVILTAGMSKADSLVFDLSNVIAGPASGNWMFNTSPTPFDPGSSSPNYAYVRVGFHDGSAISTPYGPQCAGIVSDSSLVQATSPLVNPGDVVKLVFGYYQGAGAFNLVAFQHRNVVNPAMPWDIMGQAGDFRHYAGGTCEIKVNGVVKLRALNCLFEQLSPYPAPVGPGTAITSAGWGSIDVAGSDPAWVAAYDNGFGKVEFQFQSFSPVIQSYFGIYNSRITVKPGTFSSVVAVVSSPVVGNWVSLPAAGLSLRVLSSVMGGYNQNLATIMVQRDQTNLTSLLQSRVHYLPLKYSWHIQDDFSSLAMDAAFDVTGLSRSVMSNLVVFQRDTTKQFTNMLGWTRLGAPQLTSSNAVIVTNITRGGQFLLAAVFPARVAACDSSSVTLAWDEVHNATSYTVLSGDITVPTSQWSVVTNVPGLNCKIPKLPGAQSYCVTVESP